jgi:hypothetical protein
MTNPGDSRRKGRLSKKKILESIMSKGFDQPDSDLNQLPPMRLINSLFPLLYHGEEKIKGRAVLMLGLAVARLAENAIEDARNVVRRLMWNLNDESGAIGWGSPEAMGEILARHEGLASEFAHILASYTRPEGNFLENEVLQRGLLWAIARLWKINPGLILRTDPLILPYLASEDATVRGRAAELLGEFRDKAACSELIRLLEDDSEYDTLMEEDASKRRVKDAARDALRKIG